MNLFFCCVRCHSLIIRHFVLTILLTGKIFCLIYFGKWFLLPGSPRLVFTESVRHHKEQIAETELEILFISVINSLSSSCHFMHITIWSSLSGIGTSLHSEKLSAPAQSQTHANFFNVTSFSPPS
jgi:hypothetical protein